MHVIHTDGATRVCRTVLPALAVNLVVLFPLWIIDRNNDGHTKRRDSQVNFATGQGVADARGNISTRLPNRPLHTDGVTATLCVHSLNGSGLFGPVKS